MLKSVTRSRGRDVECGRAASGTSDGVGVGGPEEEETLERRHNEQKCHKDPISGHQEYPVVPLEDGVGVATSLFNPAVAHAL